MTLSTRDCSFASRLTNLASIAKRAVKIFASRCGGNLIEFDISVRHAVRHLDSVYVRAGGRNRIIRSHKSRVRRCVAMCDAFMCVCRAVFYEISLLACPKTSSVPRRCGCAVQLLAWQIYGVAHSRSFFFSCRINDSMNFCRGEILKRNEIHSRICNMASNNTTDLVQYSRLINDLYVT